jgi:diaminopimelate epimerase
MIMAGLHEIAFTKLHGLGNDFVVTRSEGLPASLPELARAICHRHTGVGADGLLVLSRPRNRKHTARLRFFNADGSQAEMSGNGIRCAAAYILLHRLGRSPLRIETAAGVKSLRVTDTARGRWTFRVSMGRPTLAPARIPFRGAKGSRPVLQFPLRTSRGVLPATVTSMGNPHCSVVVGDFAAIDWARLGSEIERHELFPNRTNVEFVKILSRREIEVRFWERGVGETMSSGTGSCAAAVASILTRRTGRKVRVNTLGGSLEVAWPANGEVFLAGPAELIAQGTYHYRE